MRNTVGDLQKRAWGRYGVAGLPEAPVGEVRYVVGWRAEQMTRLDWDVKINGEDKWTVEVPATNDTEATTISTRQDDGEEDQTAASKELLALVGWDDTNVRAVDTNLFVAGQGDYIQTSKGWRVVSVVEKDRKKTLDEAAEVIPFLWPHPADQKKPDSPMFSVLDLLDELAWYNQQARSQSRQRVLINGVLVTSDGWTGSEGQSLWDVWNESLSAKMIDPDDLSPVRAQVPFDQVKDGINWVMPDFGYDDVLDRRVLAAIHRLAYGLPIPPEILLGMQAQSRATAFQVEENAYRAHIEPPAELVAQVAQDALRVILDTDDVEVVPNPSRMLARKNSVQDVKDAYDRGLVTPIYVREVLGIPEDAAPEADGVPPAGSPNQPTPDPSNVAADEPVTAATKTDGPDLSTLLADIDAHLSSEIAGYTAAATDRARQRLGAYARRSETVRNNPEYKGLKSAELAHVLGVDGLTAAGVDVVEQIAEPIDSTAKWWMNRIGQAWTQAATLIPGWTGQGDWVTESLDILDVALAEHIIGTLDQPEVSPLEAGDIRRVLDAAAGGN